MITKNYKCDCGHEIEKRQMINDPNPRCEKCGEIMKWKPKLNRNEPQFSYELRVLCDGIEGFR